MAQAMERSLATPMIRPRLPAINGLVSVMISQRRFFGDVADERKQPFLHLGVADGAVGTDEFDLAPREAVLGERRGVGRRGRRGRFEAFEEIGDRLLQQLRELEEATCRDADFALLVFLHDLEAHAEVLADAGLRPAGELAAQAQALADMQIDRIGSVFFCRAPLPAYLILGQPNLPIAAPNIESGPRIA